MGHGVSVHRPAGTGWLSGHPSRVTPASGDRRERTKYDKVVPRVGSRRSHRGVT
jgi:hypothetical protein